MAVRMRKERLRARLFAALVALRGLLLSNVLYLVSNLWALARKNAKTHSRWKWATALSYSGWNRWIRLTTDKLTATRTVQPLLPLGHLCSGDTCVQGTPLFRGHLCLGDTSVQGTQNLVPQNVDIIFVFATSIEGTPLSRGKGHFFWVLGTP